MTENTVSFITGAASGIGKAVSRRFSQEGSTVVMLDLDKADVETAAEEIREETGNRIFSLQADITRKEEVERAVESAYAEFKRFDILVNSAGILDHQQITEMREELWDRIIDTNLKGMFLVTQAVGRKMIAKSDAAVKKTGWGKIINISSDSAFIPVEGECAYSTSKAGILAFTRVAALEFGKHNINCNAICPGAVETPLLEEAMRKNNWKREELETASPLNKIGTPEEIAGIALFLASPESDHITGEYILATAGAPMSR